MNQKLILHLFQFALCCLFFISCSKKEIKAPSTILIQKSVFENIASINGYVEPTNTFTISCPTYVDGTVVWLIEEGSFVQKGDTVCILEDKSILENYNDIATKIIDAEMELEKLKATQALELAMMEAEVKANNAETQIANLDSLQLKYYSTVQRRIKELELKKAIILQQKLKRKEKTFKKIQSSDLKRREFNIKRLTSQLESMQKRIETLTITAPADGMIVRSTHYVTDKKILVGDPVWSNMPILFIPVKNEMKVKIEAPEGMFKRINEKDSVEYTFDAMPQNRAKGIITKKSPVGRPLKQDSKVKVFEIEASVATYDALPEPGFTCNCRIILNRVTDTIVVPQIAVFERDSIKVVYVVHPGYYEMREVRTGASSPEKIIVQHGLLKGDEITLTEPDYSLVKKKTVFSTTKQPTKSGTKK